MKLVRYRAVTVISTTLSLTVLGILVFTGTLTPAWANVVATAAQAANAPTVPEGALRVRH